MTVECTLEEFYYGCKKEINYEKIVLLADKRSEKFEVFSKEIEIKPGMGPWTEMRFALEGHEKFAHQKSDLVIKFAEIPHPKFKRINDDIIYLHKVSLLDSLLSKPVHFRTIDNEEIEIAVDEVISP